MDGNDVEAVYEVASDAVARARNGGGPTFIECHTYRLRGHYEGDPEPYRSKDEVEAHRPLDPLPMTEQRFREAGILDAVEAELIRSEARRRVEEAVVFAESSAFPEPEAALVGVYTDMTVAGW